MFVYTNYRTLYYSNYLNSSLTTTPKVNETFNLRILQENFIQKTKTVAKIKKCWLLLSLCLRICEKATDKFVFRPHKRKYLLPRKLQDRNFRKALKQQWNQCFGSGFTVSRSGSSILGWIPIRSRVFMTKYGKKFIAGKKFDIFLIKNGHLLIPRPP